MDGVGLVPCDVSWLVELAPVLWLMERDLVSLKGSAVSISRLWSIHGFNMTLGSCSSFCGSVQFSRSVVSDSLRPHESWHARPPCPSPTPGACSHSCPSSAVLGASVSAAASKCGSLGITSVRPAPCLSPGSLLVLLFPWPALRCGSKLAR